MVQPYSLDLRERVVRAVVGGQSCRTVAAIFDVSVSSVVKWCQRARECGSPAAKPMGSPLKRKLLGERDWILSRLAEEPDITLRGLVSELQARGIEASFGSLWRLLRDEGISFKKKPARKRARSSGRGSQASSVEKVTRPA